MFRLTIAALVVLILVVLASPGATVKWTLVEADHASVVVEHPLVGDANYDGEVNIIDALVIARHLVGFDPCSSVTDVNGDGETTIADAQMIAQFDALLIPADSGICVLGEPIP